MTSLTIQQKKGLIEEYECRKKNEENAAQAALADWAVTAYRLNRVPNQSTVSRIIQNGPSLSRNDITLPKNAKRNRAAAALLLKKALLK